MSLFVFSGSCQRSVTNLAVTITRLKFLGGEGTPPSNVSRISVSSIKREVGSSRELGSFTELGRSTGSSDGLMGSRGLGVNDDNVCSKRVIGCCQVLLYNWRCSNNFFL